MEENKILTEEDYEKNIEKLEKELDIIFDELIMNKNTSGFQNQEYLYNIDTVTNKIAENIDMIYDSDNEDIKILNIKSKIIKISLLLNSVFFFINTLIAILIYIFLIYKNFKIKEDLKCIRNRKLKISERLFPKLKKIDFEVDNCLNFIKYNQEQITTRATDKTKSIEERKFDIANEIIYLYIENDITCWEELPDFIKSTIITILQEDLKTDENDIKILIAIAKSKVDFENIENELTNEDIFKLIK